MSKIFFTNFFSKWCFVLTLLTNLSISAAAQMTTSAAESPSSAATGDATSYYLVLALLGSALCASIFWWRREKNKDQAVTTRGGKKASEAKSERETAATAQNFESNNAPRRENVETPSWMKTSMGNQPNGAAKKTIEIPTFDLLDTPAVVEDLPASDDSLLLVAVGKLQDTTASEEEREAAIAELSGFITQNSVDALAEVVKNDESARLRVGALNALGSFNHESVFEPILLACADSSREVKAAAARILARLSIDRTEALSRIIRSGDAERLKKSAAACVDSGMVNHAFDRLLHPDPKAARNAFAVINLLVSAGEYQPILNSISFPSDIHVRLATIEALRTLAPVKMLPVLYELTAKDNLAGEVREELEKLVAELTELTVS